MKDVSVLIFSKEDVRYSLGVRLGLVDKVGLYTPKHFEGKTLREVGSILRKRGFELTKILY
jgi:hypothetical protein